MPAETSPKQAHGQSPESWIHDSQDAQSFSRVIESGREKFFRKMREQPLIPIGSLLTCVALVVASKHLYTGDRDRLQRALRWRVGLQGLTVVAAMGGAVYSNHYAQPTSSASNSSIPTKPQNVWSQMRAEERARKDKAGFQERMEIVSDPDREKREEKALEEALLGKEKVLYHPTKTRPTIVKDQ